MYTQFPWNALYKYKKKYTGESNCNQFEIMEASITYRSKKGSGDYHEVIIPPSCLVWKTKWEITLRMERSITKFRSEELLTFKTWAHFDCGSDLILQWFTTCCLRIVWSINNLYSENLKWKKNVCLDTNVSCSDVIA